VADDVRSRTRRYLWSMGIRTVCLLLAIVAHGPLRWGLVVCAVLLPWMAVVVANAGRERDRDEPMTVHVPRVPTLGSEDHGVGETGKDTGPGPGAGPVG